MKLIISANTLQQILDHTRQEYPYEACGLVGGRNSTAEIVVPIPNASLTPRTTFEMERQAMVDAIIQFQRNGQEVVAIYHSHPDGKAEPSTTDITQAYWPDVVWLLVSVDSAQQTDVTPWTIRNGRAEPAEMEITAD
jgi:[CysO sulfur-carrier protein]-S-L-cysteine hydrolase